MFAALCPLAPLLHQKSTTTQRGEEVEDRDLHFRLAPTHTHTHTDIPIISTMQPSLAMLSEQQHASVNVVYAGQQYLSIAPRGITLSCVHVSPDGPEHSAPPSAASMKHVAAISCVRTASAPSRMAFVEWGGAATTVFASHDGDIAHDAPQWGDAVTSAMVHTSVDVCESAAITAFCALAYGDATKLCFPVSLDDNTIRVVTRIVDEDDGAVLYKLLGTILRNEGQWSTACVLERRSTGGIVLGVRSKDSTMALVEVKNERLEAMAVLTPTSGALGSFPITQLVPLSSSSTDGSIEVLALCHTVLTKLQLVLTPPTQGQSIMGRGGGGGGRVAVVQAWRWSPHDPILTIAVRDTLIYGGTQDGYVALWPLTPPLGGNSSTSNGAPVDRFLCIGPGDAVDPTTLSQQRRAPGVVAIIARHAGELITGSSDGAVSQWTRSGASAPFQPALLFPNASFASQRYGCPSIVGVASTDQYMCAADDSGMLSVWRWL